MANIPAGYEDIDDRPQGVVNMGDDCAGLEDDNATDTREYKDSVDDPDSHRDNLENR